MRGNAVLNFHTMKANILDELENPLQHRRTTDVVTPYFFLRDVENKKIRVVPRLKKYSKGFRSACSKHKRIKLSIRIQKGWRGSRLINEL